MLIEKEGNSWILKHKYDPQWIALIKTIPGRTYNGITHNWSIPYMPLENLLKMFENYHPQLGEKTKDFLKIQEIQPSTIKLYDYQKQALKCSLKMNKFLIADDMGLGKTVEALAYLQVLFEQGKIDSTIIICPKSIRNQWINQIKKFMNKEAKIIKNLRGKSFINGEIYVTNYERLRIDKPFFNKRTAVIIDEASRLKNNRTQLYKSIVSSILYPDFVLLLSGTPMENSLMDFYNILKVIYPNFMSWGEFISRHVVFEEIWNGQKFINVISGFKDFEGFKQRISNLYIRRIKDEVLDILPKNYQIRDLELPIQIKKMEIEMLEDAIKQENKDKMLGKLQILRSFMSCHNNYVSDIKSVKMEELLEVINETSEKIIVFTCFQRTAINLDDFLKENNIKTMVVTGETKEKESMVDTFKKSNIQVLISTDTLSYGIDIDEADVLIHYDLPWNPAILRQREDRIHRANSKKQKTIITLLTDSKIEKKIYSILQTKIENINEVVDITNEILKGV